MNELEQPGMDMKGPELSEERVVHGVRYRWNFEWNCLERYHQDLGRWERSSFTFNLRLMLQGEPYFGLDGDRERSEALHAAFAPILTIPKPQAQDLKAMARDFYNTWWDNLAKGHPDEITAQWLMEKHPELSAEEAEEYRLFCKANTIVFRGCYGDGSRMWPKWLAFKKDISAL